MNEKIERELKESEYRIDDAGDGIFLVIFYQPTEAEEKKIVDVAELFFQDVQWCPEPELHISSDRVEPTAVLNCFYPIERGISR